MVTETNKLLSKEHMIAFHRIVIKNFKRYRNVEIIPSETEGLFVFLGKNYLGKSTFLNAICWCLYDTQPFRDSIEKNTREEHSLLNEDAKRENQFDEVRVELEVQHDDKNYLFVRTWRPTQLSQFRVMLKRGQDWTPLNNPTIIVDSLLPSDLREYFIFAGEDAESLFSPGYETKLKNGIRKVSDIEVMDRLIDHLNTVYTEFQREFTRRSGSSLSKDAVEKKISLEKERTEKSARLKKIQEGWRSLTDTRAEYLRKIKETAAYTEKIRRREVLESRRVEIKSNQNKLEKNTNDLLTEKSPLVYLEGILCLVHAQLIADKESGKLPPSIRSEFITNLLETRKCICGREIVSADGSEEHLHRLLEDVSPADRRVPLLEDRYAIKGFINFIPEISRQLEQLRSERAQLIHASKEVERELKNISEELSGSTEAEVSGLEEGIKRIEQSMESDKREEGVILHRITQINEEIKLIDDQIRKEADQQVALLSLKNRLNILEDAKDTAEYVREKITDQVRRVISANTAKYFRELFWDQSEYEKIEFTEDYQLHVLKRGFAGVSTEFSTGEKKVLGLATLRAIGDLSGFSGVPIFFDAPLTNFGPEVEDNVLEMLPKLAPGKQVFVFSLDADKMVAFARKMTKGRAYELRKDSSTNSTLICSLGN